MTMDIQSLKIDLIHWLTQLKDKSILEKVHAIKEEVEHIGLARSQHEELEKRLDKYERGEMEFKTWEEAKANIRDKAKDAL